MTTDPAVAENDEGVRLLGSRDYEGAVAAFSKAIDLNPDFETAYRNRSQALRKLGRMAEAKSDLNRYDSNPSRHRAEPTNWRYLRAGLRNLFPSFGLGYLVLHRRTQFKISIATWFVLFLIGFLLLWTDVGLWSGVGLSPLSVSITALLSWSLVALITADHLLIATMTREWVVMGVLAVLIGSLIYLLGLAIVAVILLFRCWGFC
jgi:tetratricopeptide (TPR) repeat protein